MYINSLNIALDNIYVWKSALSQVHVLCFPLVQNSSQNSMLILSCWKLSKYVNLYVKIQSHLGYQHAANVTTEGILFQIESVHDKAKVCLFYANQCCCGLAGLVYTHSILLHLFCLLWCVMDSVSLDISTMILYWMGYLICFVIYISTTQSIHCHWLLRFTFVNSKPTDQEDYLEYNIYWAIKLGHQTANIRLSITQRR